MATNKRTLAKQHIYRCLATTLENDWGGIGAGYLREMVEGDPDHDLHPGMNNGIKLSEEALDKLIMEIIAELKRRGGASEWR